ncbi:mucosa-associated lymphoid tissue lymphoma translocation protein 1 [Elysia marginata]|uniref:Mucosa-associated lymphoid tissue lymphoma translocation protein 1 n=1 Tax=Elysia marginata TaxID=1093978 RepID=A0AAV4IZ68_9GAST|nr:mucosa-associated lymphoid tissue lymphoma translocation protein 1 [Elysia marginata]
MECHQKIISLCVSRTHEEVLKIGNADSPTEALFKKLGNLRMTIDEFISYATRAGDAVLMNIFNVHIPSEITDHPVSEFVGVEGGLLTLSVQATGFPAPEFRWFKDGDLIPGASSRHLELDDLRQQDAGAYRCAVVQGRDISNIQFSNPSIVIIKRAPDIEVKQQPQNAPVNVGGTALLSCQVWGPSHMEFQWFKGETLLTDSPKIRGSSTNELALFDIDESMLGCYYCRISSGRNYVETKGAAVQISELLMFSDKKYTATDKVALLIGCADYRGDSMLKAPNNDVHTLANIFRSLNFKVVSLLDLTRKEIIAAVIEFSKLVGQGVYCVFYFCGHGFEVSGQLYLVPCDAPQGYTNDHSVSSDKISNILLAKEPQLFCMILDVCRKPRNIYPAVLDAREAARGPNTIVVYGTSYGLKAYEDKTHGILVKHLKNFLSIPIPVETVFAKFRHAMSQETKLIKGEKKQFANVDTNLIDIGRSFADPIEYKGFTAEYNERQQVWENAHRIPPPKKIEVQFPGFTVLVCLEFEQEVSNKLNIYTTVLDPGLAKVCSAWICGIPNSVIEKAKNNTSREDKGSYCFRSYLQLPNIHRLKSNLNIRVQVSCKNPDFIKEFQVDLGLPLISALHLSEDQPDFTRTRQPQEDDESSFEESLSSKTQSLLL